MLIQIFLTPIFKKNVLRASLNILKLFISLPVRYSRTKVMSIVQFPLYVITKSYVLLALSFNYFLFQPVLHDWCNKGCGMCYPVCGMMHIK